MKRTILLFIFLCCMNANTVWGESYETYILWFANQAGRQQNEKYTAHWQPNYHIVDVYGNYAVCKKYQLKHIKYVMTDWRSVKLNKPKLEKTSNRSVLLTVPDRQYMDRFEWLCLPATMRPQDVRETFEFSFDYVDDVDRSTVHPNIYRWAYRLEEEATR